MVVFLNSENVIALFVRFTGMDMENPEADEDVEYEHLYDIVSLFKKLGFRPLSPHVMFAYSDKKG